MHAEHSSKNHPDERRSIESRPLLTIAIPTYNRANYLATLLGSLQPQLVGQDRVELLISDNCSPDSTGELVRSFAQRGLRIRYIRNETNIGADANFLQCFDEAAGSYVWIFGDDDVLEPGGLELVLPHLQSEIYDLVYVRSRGFEGEYRQASGQWTGRTRSISDAVDLAVDVNVFFTFITGNILNKRRIESVPHPPFADLIGTNLVQLGWTYAALEHHRKSLIIEDRIVATLANNTGSYGLYKVFGPTLKQITEYYLTDARVRRAIINAAIQQFFPGFVFNQGKVAKSFSDEDPHQVLAPAMGDNFRYWLFDFPLMKLPRSLAKIWLLMNRAVNKLDRALGSPLLRF